MTRAMSSELVSARGGCNRCSATFDAKNAQALAAKHHDRTKHPTWVETTMRISYGRAGGRSATANSQARLI